MSGSRAGRDVIAGMLTACGLIMSCAPASAQSTPADPAPGGWGGKTEVRPAATHPAPRKAKPAPPASNAAQAPGVARSTKARGSVLATSSHAKTPTAGANMVVGYGIEGGPERTAIAFDLAGPVEVNARSLANPPRVIVDLPETEFRLPAGAGRSGQGLVTSFRFGLIEAGKSRIVLDTSGPVRVERAEVVLADAGGAFRLELEIVPTSARELAAIELAEAALTFRPALPEAPAPRPREGLPGRPVIVVDPGHGGIDSGASGARVAEKDLVLSVARQIEAVLRASGRYDVVMTRTRDVFVALDERVAISRRHAADMFISIHADSLPSRENARGVRGATVYTLAEQATDDLTRRVADNENAVDLLAGLPVTMAADDQVRDILLDLMRRETMGYAADFRQILVGELGSGVLLSHNPRRSGPFRVLRQPSSPAVLVELGYISNADDERVMLDPAWQARLGGAVLRAIDAHFSQRLAAGR